MYYTQEQVNGLQRQIYALNDEVSRIKQLLFKKIIDEQTIKSKLNEADCLITEQRQEIKQLEAQNAILKAKIEDLEKPFFNIGYYEIPTNPIFDRSD